MEEVVWTEVAECQEVLLEEAVLPEEVVLLEVAVLLEVVPQEEVVALPEACPEEVVPLEVEVFPWEDKVHQVDLPARPLCEEEEALDQVQQEEEHQEEH